MTAHQTQRPGSGPWSAEPLPDQSGKLALVTGANGGIGRVIVRELARAGARLVLACRSAERGLAALARLREEVPGSQAELRMLDLASLASIREFAATWDHDRLDLLVNNAGVVMVRRGRTVDGFETHMGVNHFGTFALTGLMLATLLKSDDPRVVTVASEAQLAARLDLDDLDSARRYSPVRAYGRSKKANIYFALELHRRASTAGVPLRSMVVAPGMTDSGVLTKETDAAGGMSKAAARLVSRLMAQPVDKGAWTTLYAATEPGLPGGSYVTLNGFLQMRGDRPVRRDGYRAANDEAIARRLWGISVERTGVAFDALNGVGRS
ncbi:oxidoreductase [Actinoallomurus oryzae]|uniref:Oxidoreductase n=1 Tax=Actinoallomurus oryzae TaxID=502180 RepID=A0ABP8R921_9ACTN